RQHDLAHRLDVGTGAHERDGQEVDTFGSHRLREREVVGGGCRDAQSLRRQVHPWATFDMTTAADSALCPGGADALDYECDGTVADDDAVALANVLQQRRVIDA